MSPVMATDNQTSVTHMYPPTAHQSFTTDQLTAEVPPAPLGNVHNFNDVIMTAPLGNEHKINDVIMTAPLGNEHI